MIQKFTCVPKSDYDVIIISNGTINQIESKLIEINEHANNTVPLNSKITYLNDFKALVTHLHSKDIKTFPGKVVFMFFNGLEYIQQLISDLIDHYSKYIVTHFIQQNKSQINSFEKLENVYLYFDSSITMIQRPSSPYDFLLYTNNDDYESQLNTIANIANDVIKKMNFVIGKIRGVYIDDLQLDAKEGIIPMRSSRPLVEKTDLSCFSQLVMSDIIL